MQLFHLLWNLPKTLECAMEIHKAQFLFHFYFILFNLDEVRGPNSHLSETHLEMSVGLYVKSDCET